MYIQECQVNIARVRSRVHCYVDSTECGLSWHHTVRAKLTSHHITECGLSWQNIERARTKSSVDNVFVLFPLTASTRSIGCAPIYIYIYTYIYIYIHTHTPHTHVYMHIYIYHYIYVSVYLCLYVSMCLYVYVSIYLSIYRHDLQWPFSWSPHARPRECAPSE